MMTAHQTKVVSIKGVLVRALWETVAVEVRSVIHKTTNQFVGVQTDTQEILVLHAFHVNTIFYLFLFLNDNFT